jgi:hypothetical protein
LNVEYHRDVRPIFKRSCVACHTTRDGKSPAADLDLDADDAGVQIEHLGTFPGTYYRLALDERARFGYKPIGWDSWGQPNASRYIRSFQSRRSLLVWKIFGERLDGFTNDDHPSEATPGDRENVMQRGRKIDLSKHRSRVDLDYTGAPMPPPEAVNAGHVKGLSDEDRRTIVRWIDLGCPIDLDYDPKHPERRGYGWMLDDNRPVITLTHPTVGENPPLTRLLIGMHDYGSGLDLGSFRVTADFEVDGIPAGQNLARHFQPKTQGVWEWRLTRPVGGVSRGTLRVAVRDRQGNLAQLERAFSVTAGR